MFDEKIRKSLGDHVANVRAALKDHYLYFECKKEGYESHNKDIVRRKIAQEIGESLLDNGLIEITEDSGIVSDLRMRGFIKFYHPTKTKDDMKLGQ